VDHLQWKFAKSISFQTHAAIDAYIDRGCVKIALENDEPCGYVLAMPYLASNLCIRPIFQTAVCMDAQRRHHGLAIISQHANDAVRDGQSVLQANVRDGIDANDFFLAAGFVKIASWNPNTQRKRLINCWRKCLTEKRPMWFCSPPSRAGHTARLITNMSR